MPSALCASVAQTTEPILLQCQALEVIRDKHMKTIRDVYPTFPQLPNDIQVKALLDSYSVTQDKCDRTNLEAVSRNYIYSIHCRRTCIAPV